MDSWYTEERMERYRKIDMARAERLRKRVQRHEREERIGRVKSTVVTVAKVALATAIAYGCMLFGCL